MKPLPPLPPIPPCEVIKPRTPILPHLPGAGRALAQLERVRSENSPADIRARAAQLERAAVNLLNGPEHETGLLKLLDAVQAYAAAGDTEKGGELLALAQGLKSSPHRAGGVA